MVRYGRSDGQSAGLSGSKEYSHTGQVTLRVVKRISAKSIKQIIEDLRPEIEKIAGVVVRLILAIRWLI